MQRGVILLVAPADDTHALAVKRRIDALEGPRAEICDFATFPIASSIAWTSALGGFSARVTIAPPLPQGISRRGAAEVIAARRTTPLAEFDLGEIVCVWLRRARRPLVHPRLATPELRRFAGETTADLIEGFMDSVPVHNPRAAETRASHKLHQLRMAESCGLPIPRTLTTTDPAAARNFVRTLRAEGRSAIYKQNTSGMPDGPPTRGFLESDWDRLGDVELCPTTFQERIEGGSDLRVAIVGNRIFAAEWRPAGGPSTSVDVRLDGDSARMWRTEIEPAIATSLRNLHAALGLTFAVYDLKIDACRGPVFLECNPTGQWLDLETEAGHPVSETVARVLARGGAAPDDATGRTFSDADLVNLLREQAAAV